MYLKRLSILNYKNIAEAELTFSPSINCFLGNNGEGKTNLLDAVYYLAFCKSHLTHIDSHNIKHEEAFMMLKGSFLRNEEREEISVGLKRAKRKSFKRNNKEYEKIAEHIGLVPLVMVSPADNILIQGGSTERRKFVDSVISQYDKAYLQHLLHYKHLLQQRNALLKSREIDLSIYEVIEDQMDDLAAIIYNKRQEFFEDFMPIFQHYYQFVSNQKEKVAIKYVSHLSDGNLKDQLQTSRSKDSILGYTSKGVHKDELSMFLGTCPLKQVASQGQSKSFLVALKLAQFDLIRKVHKLFPILLLDDVFDKLDTTRVEKIVELVSGANFGQIFMTDTNREHLDNLLSHVNGEYQLFRVKEGEIYEN